jgi:hypothetical protein
MSKAKNTYLANGHNDQMEHVLPIYLPGNDGLLYAEPPGTSGRVQERVGSCHQTRRRADEDEPRKFSDRDSVKLTAKNSGLNGSKPV